MSCIDLCIYCLFLNHCRCLTLYTSDHKLTLKCLQPLIEIVLNTSLKLTSGDWHLFQLNIENNQLRVAVANEKRIIDLPNGTQSPGKYSTRLYVGDKPM